ncbi:PrgI family protein [Streptococcus ovuberis]|uniref:PrgI family protein n=1 Tax=Streptococcus ovuberis TaxID=1936207 RepID=A0A7X6S0E5_9STRE|nr:PrgI family protein [Streptococcus ovuberis]NKZ19697.1 PrgI family protein [Streptococcus ovuberis]
MAKLGSEFLKEFDHFEKPSLFKSSKRLVIFIIGVFLVSALSVGLFLINFPLILIYLLLFMVLVPLTLYCTGKDEAIKERVLYFITIHERSYQTQFQNREEDLIVDDFKVRSKTKESQADES